MTLPALVLLCATAPAQEVAVPPPPPPEILPHAALCERLRALEQRHGALARVERLGESREGREILALRISRGDPPAGKPGLFVVGNLDGPQVFASAIALWEAERLIASAEDEAVRALLDAATIYVVPRANPDPAEARFRTPLAELETGGRGVDNDRDGRSGEDAPSDVDGDGVVAWMRYSDPEGTWMEDPSDPRALVEADPRKGEQGRWKLALEGRDLDRDERVAEDPPGDTILSRSFPHDWKEHDAASGTFPTDEPEARALADFLVRHRDVALVVAYGNLDNLVDKPATVKADAPRVKLVPPSGVVEPDGEILAELGRRYAEITASKTKGRGDGSGSFQTWAYHQRGLLCLSIAPWDIPLDAKKPGGEAEAKDAEPEKGEEGGAEKGAADDAQKQEEKEKKKEPGDDAKRLAWIDAQGEGARFLPWKSFQHPELGAVEIGGFAPFARAIPPEAQRAEIAQKQLDFLLSLRSTLARVELVECTAKDLGDGLVEVEAVLRNGSLLPLETHAAVRSGTVRPARVTLVLPAGASILAGQRETLVRGLEGMGGAKARRELRWLVTGAPPESIGVEAETDHAGRVQARPEVRR